MSPLVGHSLHLGLGPWRSPWVDERIIADTFIDRELVFTIRLTGSDSRLLPADGQSAEVIVPSGVSGNFDDPLVLQRSLRASANWFPRRNSRRDQSPWHCVKFQVGISHGRKVIGHDNRSESCWLTSPVPYGLDRPRNGSGGTRTLCQPSLVGSHHMTVHIPFQKRRSVNNVLLTFSTCIRRPFSAKLVKGHFRLTRLEQIGSAGTFTSRNWTIGFGPKSHVRPCALST